MSQVKTGVMSVRQMFTHGDRNEVALLQGTVFSFFLIYYLDEAAGPTEDKGPRHKVLTLCIDMKIKMPSYLEEN